MGLCGEFFLFFFFLFAIRILSAAGIVGNEKDVLTHYRVCCRRIGRLV